MPIVRMISNNPEHAGLKEFPEGARCPLEFNRADDRERLGADHAVVTYETHVGLCLFEREHNMRDDSDFYMTVWNPTTNAPEEIMFASTRGWTYPCMASRRDATDEVREAFATWSRRRERSERASRIRACRRSDELLARDLNLPSRAHATRFRKAFNSSPITLDHASGGLSYVFSPSWHSHEYAVFLAVVKLAKSEKLRSSFKMSLQAQVREWLLDLNSNRERPLSPRQLEFVR